MYGTVSKGILKQPTVKKLLETDLIAISDSQLKAPDQIDLQSVTGFVGWGRKPNTQKLSDVAEGLNKPFIQLEDGFVGYWGHPGSGQSTRLSLVVDPIGIYYDAYNPSLLETYIQSSSELSQIEIDRGSRLINRIKSDGWTKYNLPCVSSIESLASDSENDCIFAKRLSKRTTIELPKSSSEFILVIDQTYGDKSIEFGMADQGSFNRMLNSALADNPTAEIIVKTHPDVIAGKRKGYLHQPRSRVRFVSNEYQLSELFELVDKVYTVTSQVGFEALIYGKQVHCFGMPFYAGWGLTKDYVQIPDHRKVVEGHSPSIQALVYAALVQYSRYWHPVDDRACEIEEILDWMSLQKAKQTVSKIYAYGFSLWKRSFLKTYLQGYANEIEFIQKIPPYLEPSSVVLCWGRSNKELLQKTLNSTLHPIWVMEDGFIRSVGLGADLKRPSSLVIDRSGIYYDCHQESDLEKILNTKEFSDVDLAQAELLANSLVESQVTKYNVGHPITDEITQVLQDARNQGKKIILVPGQVESDASIKFGVPESNGNLITNTALLEQVREDYPNDFIIFKPHPDVVSGNRDGKFEPELFLTSADMVMTKQNISDLYQIVDRVCVLTSLSGFEALIRGIAVTCYGAPFYSGWGLTSDKVKIDRRGRILSLHELVAGVLIHYPINIDWDTKYKVHPLDLVKKFSGNRELEIGSTWFSRITTKIKYLLEAVLSK